MGHWGTFTRKYRGPDDPGAFKGIIEKLSFACSNIMQGKDQYIVRLSQETDDGTVTVMRAGNVEYIDTELSGAKLEVILTADRDHTFTIAITGTGLGSLAKKILANITHHTENYHDPDYDKTIDPPLGILSIDNKNFDAPELILGQNRQTPINYDWHNNKFIALGFTPGTEGYELRTYDDIGYPMDLSILDTYINYSISPYTYYQTLEHMARYIDQAKRTHRQYFDSGTLDSSLSFMEELPELPYGKRPFTLDASKNVTTHNEVAVPGTSTSSEVNLRNFWPFVPYLHELPYLNLQYYGKYDSSLRQGILYPDSSASITDTNMQYLTGVVETSASLRSAFVSNSESETSDSHSDTTPYLFWSGLYAYQGGGSLCNTWNYTTSLDASWGSDITKSETIGSIGNLLDIHINQTITVNGTREYATDETVTKTTTFPSSYYLFWAGTGEENSWPPGTYSDYSSGLKTLSDEYSSTTTITSYLKIGNTVIDTGLSTFEYAYTKWNKVEQTSTQSAVVVGAMEECHIEYTSLTMGPSEEQYLTVSGNHSGPVSWKLKGPGSLSSTIGDGTVAYRSPTTIENCSDYAVIQVMVGRISGCSDETTSQEVCDSISISISTYPNTDEIAFWSPPPDSGGVDSALPAECIGVGEVARASGFNCLNEFIQIGANAVGCDTGVNCGWKCPEDWECDPPCAVWMDSCGPTGFGWGVHIAGNGIGIISCGAVTDVRTDEMIANGCCPGDLL